MIRRPPRSPLFPSPTLFRSEEDGPPRRDVDHGGLDPYPRGAAVEDQVHAVAEPLEHVLGGRGREPGEAVRAGGGQREDRKSTRLNSSHANISYAVFCLKKKN